MKCRSVGDKEPTHVEQKWYIGDKNAKPEINVDREATRENKTKVTLLIKRQHGQKAKENVDQEARVNKNKESARGMGERRGQHEKPEETGIGNREV